MALWQGMATMSRLHTEEGLDALANPVVRSWFRTTFPAGPTAAQRAAWPVIASGGNLLLISPTGTGKTLAAFLAIIDRLCSDVTPTPTPGVRCVYVSPLRSLAADIERNLAVPLEAIQNAPGHATTPIRVGVRTGDTSAHERRRQRDDPPRLLITTPESLALLLSQNTWNPHWQHLTHIIIDEIHSLVPTKRGADLAVSIERLTALAASEPFRIGLSATCRPAGPVARFLVGPERRCRVIEADQVAGGNPPRIEVESLLKGDEAPHRGLSHRRLLQRIRAEIARNRTIVIFANTRALTERITHDLRRLLPAEAIAAHHSALDAERRRAVEADLKNGRLKSIVTSTSLELGVDLADADLSVLVGLPGSVARCLQRVGRAGHQVGATSRGILFAATPAELAGAAVTARAARADAIEPLRVLGAPLDVLCQQVVGMACVGECADDAVYQLLRKSAPFEHLARGDFDDCLRFLAGELAAPPGAFEPEPGAAPRWTAPRIWRDRGRFGLRHGRVARWLRRNVGTIHSEESIAVQVDHRNVGTLDAAYAERLIPGDRFLLDGRPLKVLRADDAALHAAETGGDPDLPRWASDRQSLSPELAREVALFRFRAAELLALDGLGAFREWLDTEYQLDADSIGVLERLFEHQAQVSRVPDAGMLLIEESPCDEGATYTFHAPLSRDACEALGRAVAARLGKQHGRDISLAVADLGWSIHAEDGPRLDETACAALLDSDCFREDVLMGMDRGELLAARFRHVAATALMVLRNPEGARRRVGGLNWVSRRLFPLVQAACPDHPLIREARREVLEDRLDVPGALRWLESRPTVCLRRLDAPSPFTLAWIAPAETEAVRFEPPSQALKRLHARLNP